MRRAPHLAGHAVAVASETDHPLVITCSRAAWEAGVRPGMQVTRARQLIEDLEVRSASGQTYRRAIESVADSLLGLSATVDLGGDHEDVAPNRALYLYVPTGTRGDSFGAKILSHLGRQGFRARIGIADDRFSAWVAAATARGDRLEDDAGHTPFAQTTTSVPRGGSAAFLAPMPLTLLPLDRDVLSMLRSLGIRTLGDFATLPPPSMGQRWNERGVDLRTLARGDDPTKLRSFAPRGPVIEYLEIEQPLTDTEPLAFLLRPMLDRICDRLRGRGTVADRLAIRLMGDDDAEPLILPLARPTAAGRDLVEASRAAIARRRLRVPVEAIEVAVLREVEIEATELADEPSDDNQLTLSPLMRPSREAHRRTMRGQRGKKHRRRRRTGDRIRGLFE